MKYMTNLIGRACAAFFGVFLLAACQSGTVPAGAPVASDGQPGVQQVVEPYRLGKDSPASSKWWSLIAWAMAMTFA